MEYTHVTKDKGWKYQQPEKANAEGMLQVSENPPHQMYWHEYGKKDGEPVLFIHGGPGGGTDAKYARFFDPERYRIIMFDQRGCGKSEPLVKDDPKAGLADNDTAHLVEDIEKLRTELNITGKMHVFGGSWGSTLAMAYAQKHPENVQVGGLVLRGIFLCNKRDLHYYYQGNAATYEDNKPYAEQDFSKEGGYRAYHSDGPYTIPPELHDEGMKNAYAAAWHDFVTAIQPKEDRVDMIKAYHDRFHDDSVPDDEKLKLARAWTKWEGITSYLCQDTSPEKLGKFNEDDFALSFAMIENEYFYRSLQGQDPMLSNLMSPENLDTISKLQPKIVHGKYDQVCTLASALHLRGELEKRGEPFTYQETFGGHAMTEMATCAALTKIMDDIPRMWTHRVAQSQEPDFSKHVPDGL